MPVNSFADYPMTWKPSRAELAAPIYLSLANLLERDILRGALPPGTKLPPQRELADYLDLNLSTITRVYKLCEQKGLLHAVTGRGTFVAPSADVRPSVVCESGPVGIDLGTVHAFYTHNKRVRDAALEVLRRPFSEQLFEYANPLGTPRQRRICAGWLQRFGVPCDERNVLMTAGSQNALAIALAALFSPGDRIAVDPYTYPNFIGLANLLHIQLIAVPGDRDGMLPEALDKACACGRIRGIYLMPSCGNPTNLTISESRRAELARVIEGRDILILEDEVYGLLQSRFLPPFFARLPDQTVHISGLSKPLAAGLRVGCLAAPTRLLPQLEQGIYNINIKAPSLNAEIAITLVESGAYEQILREKREMAIARNRLYDRYFPSDAPCLETLSQWLRLPEGCGGRSFELQAEGQGVRVFGAERFSVGDGAASNAVRIATATPLSMEALEAGLTILREIVEQNRSCRFPLII